MSGYFGVGFTEERRPGLIDYSRLLRSMFTVVLIFAGLALFQVAPSGKVGDLVNGLGLSLIVSGIVALFRELVIARAEGQAMAEQVATRLSAELTRDRDRGLKRIRAPQRVHDGYNQWVVSKHRCELFLAGRSVLHQVQDGLNGLNLRPVEELIYGKLKNGSVIRILFLDPRSNLVSRLCREEGQSEREFLEDMATSLGICRRIYELIMQSPALPLEAELHIRMYDELPHFSYHRYDDDVLVGMYFISPLGSTSPAFQVTDAGTKKFFNDHFTSIFDRVSADGCVVELTSKSRTPEFDADLYGRLCDSLIQRLGRERCVELMGTR